MAVPSFPFPQRNPAYPNTHDIIVAPMIMNAQFDIYRQAYERAMNTEAKVFDSQYSSITAELSDSFTYVSPANNNGKTYSVKFAEIIKNAANVYELISRVLYGRFYNDKDKINIFNFLALDVHVDFSRVKLNPYACYDLFPDFPEVTHPFVKLSAWDRCSLVEERHKPGWWTAYNKLKHSNSGLQQHATLANAIAAAAAIHVLISKTYGFGRAAGGDVTKPEDAKYTVSRSKIFF
jgi:hypothetical protein